MIDVCWMLAGLRARLPRIRRLSRAIQRRKITFVSRRKLRRLAQSLYLVRSGSVPGIYLEAGVALGGTAVMIAQLKPKEARLCLYDVFGLIPPPGDNDSPDAKARFEVIASGKAEGIGGEAYYGYNPDVKLTVIANLHSFGLDLAADQIQLVEGLFENTLFPDAPVAFAHIDCDWYDPVMTCLTRIWPVLSPGGVMLFDDYRSYDGCRKAVDAFRAGRADVEVLFSDVSCAIRKK